MSGGPRRDGDAPGGILDLLRLASERPRDALARAHDVRVAIEMHPQNLVFSPVTLRKLVDLTGATNVGAEMDPSHLMWQGMDVAAIAKVAFTSEDRVRDVIRNFNADGFGSLYPKYKGGHPPKFTLGQRREIKKIAKAKPAEYDLPFSTWSLAKLAEFLVAEGVVDDISHEGLRVLLREEGVTFQRLKTWKASKDPRYAAKKARVEQLYAIADREAAAGQGDPEIVFCVDEFGPLNLQPRPGRQWAAVSGKGKEPGRAPRTMAEVPASTPASKALSAELRRHGFTFTGPVTAYATMQACGIVNDHLAACFCRDR